MDRLFPRLFVAGFPKCGSSSLFTWITDHPGFTPPIVKEPHYFVDPSRPLRSTESWLPNDRDNTIDDYLALWPSNSAVRVDGTPFYLYYPQAREAITKMKGAPLVLAIIRRPSDRVLSLFRYAQNNVAILDPRMTFAKFLEAIDTQDPCVRDNRQLQGAIEHSNYGEYLRPARRELGDRIRILTLDDLSRDPGIICAGIAQEFGLDTKFYSGYKFGVKNTTSRARSLVLQRVKHRLLMNDRTRSGPIRKLGRSTYRLINLSSDLSPGDDSILQTLAEIDRRTRPDIERLADNFNLDLSSWLLPR